MQWHREEYIELMTFGKVEKQMFVELFGTLVGLDKEWKEQGATQDEINLTAFGFDYVPIINCGGNTYVFGGVKPQVLEENDEYIISKDILGRTMKLCKGYATKPLPLDYPVADMDSWIKIKHMFEFHEDRIDWDQVAAAKEAQAKGTVVLSGIPGGFDLPRLLMGEENCCICYYEQPELMEDILSTIFETAFKVLDRISDKLVIDRLHVHEDMAGKCAPMIGPDLFIKYVKPYYRRIWDMLSSKGTRLFSQDSDGNMNVIIDAILDSGVNILLPNEPAAGMDIVELRKKHGKRLAFMGGIDKHVLRGTKEDIRKELEYKLQPLMQEGGTAFGLDHRITNGTPLENYKYYVDTAREMLNLPQIIYRSKRGVFI